ncbi:hypothetical protein SASPL_115012 [Salvia splendens]|uniref:RNase H type-1 domain-containing protein n=1 Tax=Salvia splendens TaxID=180675 RepID=A0A8X8Y4E0_SALSN|nr:hypothetical protein SASPL_115012 [Salvia splendens]
MVALLATNLILLLGRRNQERAGGTLRDDGGNLICGFKAKVVASSRMDATLQAVSIGLNMAMERGQQIWLEIGEQGIAQMLTARQYGAATMRHQLTEIKNKLKARNTKISYIAIEGMRDPRNGVKKSGAAEDQDEAGQENQAEEEAPCEEA